MHVFDYRFLKNKSVNRDILNRAVNIAKLDGRVSDLLNRESGLTEALARNAILMSVVDSNAIEGIGTSSDRVVGLVGGSVRPTGHDEDEMVGYSEALGFIHKNHGNLQMNKETILTIYGILMSRTQTGQVTFKKRDNVIVDRDADGNICNVYGTVPAKDTERCVEQMLCAYMEVRDDPDVNPLLLIPCIVMDFLRIHPFPDGNGRMSRLLTTLLLYQEGYTVCRYVSLESKMNSSKKDYYRVLEESQIGWFENSCDFSPFIGYFLGELFLCYRDLNMLAGRTVGRRRKTEGLELFLGLTAVPVSKRELCDMFPEISETSVERVLKNMCDSGRIGKVGSGRSVRYVRMRKDRQD